MDEPFEEQEWVPPEPLPAKILALIFDTESEAQAEARKVEAWAAGQAGPRLTVIIIPHNGRFACPYLPGYPAEGEIVDLNYVEPGEGEPET